MGCTSSTPSRVAPPAAPAEGALSTAETAERLSITLNVPKAALLEALPGLNRCFQARLPFRKGIYKAIDLAILTTMVKDSDGKINFGGAGSRALPPDLAKELSMLSSSSKKVMTKLFREQAHKSTGGHGWFPAIGQGTSHLYSKAMSQEKDKPLAVAHEHGCRLFHTADPLEGMPGFYDPHHMAADLVGKDMSSAVYVSTISPICGRGGYDGVMTSVRNHEEALVRGGAAPNGVIGVQETDAQPWSDCHTLFGCVGVGPGFAPDAEVPVDECWRACEDLVYAGKVRALGVCNVTLLQLRTLLGICRIRPCVLQMEHHPWVGCAAMDELIAFCDAEGIACQAHTPLCQMNRADDKRLQLCPGLTPAQAILRFSLDKGMSVIPGADELWQIKENQATPLDIPAPTAQLTPLEEGPVGAALANISDAWRSYIMVGRGGTLERRSDGHWYGGTQEGKDEAKLAAQEPSNLKISSKHAEMFSQLTPIIDGLTRGASVAERRRAVTSALAALEEGNESRLLGQMQVVHYPAFVAHGAIPRRSAKTPEANLHVAASSLPETAKVLFISQRWLRRAHPDDEANTKHKSLVTAVEAWAKGEGVETSDVYVWFDFASIDQDDFAELVRGVNALGLYIACCDAFISFAHDEYWNRAWCLSEQMFGDAVRLPRFVLSLDGVLSPLDTGETLRQTLVDPTTGDLTVEDDRPVIECLNVVAYSMRAKLHMGNTAAMIMRTRMEKTLDLAADGDGGAGSEIAGTHGVTAAA